MFTENASNQVVGRTSFVVYVCPDEPNEMAWE